jgi:DNA-binding protein H-NS
MAKISLSRMDLQSLMALRKRVDEHLVERRAVIEKQLVRMGSAIASLAGKRAASGKQRRSSLKGRKVAPKYRSPSGETWAGRGARPRWLVAAIKSGKKLEKFLIDKSARSGRKKRKSKR